MSNKNVLDAWFDGDDAGDTLPVAENSTGWQDVDPAPHASHEAAIIIFADDRAPLSLPTSKGAVNISLTLREGATAVELERLLGLFRGAIEAGLLLPRGYATGDPALAAALRGDGGQAPAPAKVTPALAKSTAPVKPAHDDEAALTAAFERLKKRDNWGVNEHVYPVNSISTYHNDYGHGLAYMVARPFTHMGKTYDMVRDAHKSGQNERGPYNINPLRKLGLWPELQGLFDGGATAVHFETPLYVRFELKEYTNKDGRIQPTVNVKGFEFFAPNEDGDMLSIRPAIGKVYSPSGAASPETDADIPF